VVNNLWYLDLRSDHLLIQNGAEETANLYRQINRTQAPYPKVGIKQLFEAQAIQRADAVAVVCGGDSLTYRRLNQLANGLAEYLIGIGVGPAATVGTCINRSIDLIVALVAIAKCGAVYVPILPDWPAELRQRVAVNSQIKCLITGAEPAELAHPGSYGSYDDYAVVRVSEHRRLVEGNPDADASADGLAYIMFTSGSTGVPKGVKIRNAGVVRLITNARYADLGPSSVVLHTASPTFDAATFEIWGPLLNGGTCVVYDGRHLRFSDLAKVVQDAGVTCAFLTTALFNAIVEEAPDTLRGVGTILFGGENPSIKHVRKALAAYGTDTLVHMYGPTECTTFATYHPVSEVTDDLSALAIGQPIQNTTLYVLQDGKLCGPGEVGEIVLGGAGVAAGYVDEATRSEKFQELLVDGVVEDAYMTGDLGHLTAEGDLVFDGRRDDQVKVNGYRIELSAISFELDQCSLVKRSYVTVTDGVAGERFLIAFIVYADESADAAAIRRFLFSRLAPYMIPTAIYECDEFPLLASGKVDRRALLERAGSG
jgi:D-alanine--poly(phosphoribitol) ligase subunit 1